MNGYLGSIVQKVFSFKDGNIGKVNKTMYNFLTLHEVSSGSKGWEIDATTQHSVTSIPLF